MCAWQLALFNEVGLIGESGSYTGFATKRSAKILALLALSRNGTLTRDDLCNLLWPDDQLDANRLKLRQELTRLRKALGIAACVVVATNDSVRICRELYESDLDILKRAGVESDHAFRIATSEFLPGWDDTWAIAERNQLIPRRLHFSEKLSEALIDQHEFERALQVAQAGIELDPENEPLRLLAMKAHAGLGSLTNALGEYRRLRREKEGALTEEEALAQASPAIVSFQALPLAPAPVDTFHGRSKEVQSLQNFLDASCAKRLMTVVGAGGIGKTRLVIEAIHNSQAQIGFINFAELPSDGNATEFLADQIFHGQTYGNPLHQLRKHWENEHPILVLDNLEHLQDSSQFILDLLKTIPHLRLIVTSRRPTKIAGEQIISLQPLPELESIEMLTDLASVVQGSNVKCDLLEIVDHCGGMPLALRIAAARLRILTPHELARELHEACTFAADLPDLPERQRDMGLLFDLAVKSLPPDTYRVLRAMVEFPSGVTRDLAKRLTSSPIDPHIEELLDQALVWLDDEITPLRIRILEPIRKHLLAAPDANARSMFVEAMRSKAAELRDGRKPTLPADMLVLTQESNNFRLALHYGFEISKEAQQLIFEKIWRFENSIGRAAETEAIARRMLDDPELPQNARGNALMMIAWKLVNQGSRDEAIDLVLRAKEAFERAGNEAEAWSSHKVYVEFMRHKMPRDEHYRCYQEIVDWMTANDPDCVTSTLNWRSRSYMMQGMWAEAEADLNQVYQAAIKNGCDEDIVNAGVALMHVSDALGDTLSRDEYADRVKKALEIVPIPINIATYYHNLAIYALHVGQYADSEDLARKALDEVDYLDNVLYLGPIRDILARSLAHQGRFKDARLAIRKNGSAVKAGFWRTVVSTLNVLAEIEKLDGSLDKAQFLFSLACQIRSDKKANLTYFELRLVEALQTELGEVKSVEYDLDEVEKWMGGACSTSYTSR